MGQNKLNVAFYRVTIWRKTGKKLIGVRELGHSNVEFATNYFRLQASKHLHDMIDIEAALLSNNSTRRTEVQSSRSKAKRRHEMA
ncbi:hypothetical protein EXU57_22950 [Segetibacter sp. 3557_3]|uniref:hypothetical protein n=1 Tax=Segetibacter sp. 3557_3 TaxID=2547429 RepID=UPI001058EDD4|nr:hypothetical protein [Segetibacter sp. 3557_3]TDH18463.1 hypothetical protein EXU57_22950 [Segetibacter sp. 3557_3]